MPGSTSDFHTPDFRLSPLDPTALAARQARGIHSIQPFLEIFLPCRFFKAFGKQNCWRLIGIQNQTGPGEGGPHVGQARPAVPKHPRSAGLRLWGVQCWVSGTRLVPTYRATVGCGLSRGAASRESPAPPFVSVLRGRCGSN